MYAGQTYSSPEEALAHYGVKGMKWGVRKREPQPDPEGYTKRMQKNDRGSFLLGKNKGVENIKRSMNEEGLSRKQAYEKELGRRNKVRGLVVATAYVGYNAYLMGVNKDTVAYGISKRAETKRGERRAKEYINTRGLPQQTRKPKEKYAKPRRGGTYKITDL
jgi:hypothetical protein